MKRIAAGALALSAIGLLLAAETSAPAANAAPLPNGATSFQIALGNKAFTYNLQPSSVATFKFAPNASSAQVALTTTKASPAGGVFDKKLATSTVSFGTKSSLSPTIPIDPTATRQPIEGFGAAMTESAALALNSLSSSNKTKALKELFGPSGARFNIVRLPMGSSDFNASNKFTTYDDSNTPDPDLTKFSVSRDATIMSVLQAAKAQNANIKLLGVPWSAPAWMKTNGSLTCNQFSQGRLRPEYRTAYANYFVKFIQAYKAKNLPVFMVSMQNEPHLCKNNSYPMMRMDASEQAALAGQLRPALNASGLNSVKIMAWDHNWDDDYAQGVAAQYPADAVNAPGGSNIDAIGYHHYGATEPSFQSVGVATGRAVYMTEGTGTTEFPIVANNLVWEIKNDFIGSIRNGARAVLYWNLALTDHGPTQGCNGCRGLLEVNGQTKKYTQSEDLIYWQHFSKFVDPGAVRIDTPNVTAPLENVAFKNPDGSIVIVVLNTDPVARGLLGHVVQNTSKQQSWLVGLDGRRRYVGDAATLKCLKDQKIPGPDVVDNDSLNALPDVNGVWAVCGASRIGTGSLLQPGTYAKSPNGKVRLDLLAADGRVVLTNNKRQVWTTGVVGDTLKLESSGELVQYNGGTPVWSSGTGGRGITNLFVRDDGTIALAKSNDQVVWTSTSPTIPTTTSTSTSSTTSTSTTTTTLSTNPTAYYGSIVQWDGDPKAQKTSWLVGPDGNRRYINDIRTFDCMKAQNIPGPVALPSSTLENLPDLHDVWALCGDQQMGTDSMLQRGTYMQSANKKYKLAMLADGSVKLTNASGVVVWTTGQKGDRFILQADGNLAHRNGNTVLWQTNTTASPGRYFRVEDSGDLKLFDVSNALVWHSNTAGA